MVLKGGSSALHILGDIGRGEDEFIRVFSFKDGYYTGQFEEGYGFINVKFRAKDCRPLTAEEVRQLNRMWYAISGRPLWHMHLDSDGNQVTA